MSSSRPDLVPAYYILLTRCFTVVFGCIAVWWGIVGFPVFSQESSIERVAGRIVAGEPFKNEALSKQLPILRAAENSANCRPLAVRSAAIIRLRNVEDAMSSGNKDIIDERSSALRNSIRASLSCSPADPFLWLVYYWIKDANDAGASEQLRYLRMSYQLGPNEGWIGLKRNYVAFSVYEQLPPGLAEMTIDEFVALLETGRLSAQLAGIFTGPAWHVRHVILPRLKSISDWRLTAFVDAVHRLGYEVEVDLPRADKPDRRPWQ